MTPLRFKTFANLYQDSVTLMQLAARLRGVPGVQEAACVMATAANLEQLGDAGLALTLPAAPSDLLVVVQGDEAACGAALEMAQATLTAPPPQAPSGGEFQAPLTSLAQGVQALPGANVALISVPGDYAAAEALKALSLGLHVMLFSDNVSIEDEVVLKAQAQSRGLLMMGPDCGTAILNGVPLGFANAVRRGGIGLVAASGTGLQEVTSRIHNRGAGVSQAIGTGGRDLHERVGGATMLAGLAALAADPATQVLVLISKPPATHIAQRILVAAAACGKPVVVHFLGAAEQAWPAGVTPAHSLREAADLAVALANGHSEDVSITLPGSLPALVQQAVAGIEARMAPAQQAVRALFTGGTFCYEAQLSLLGRGLACSSNAPAHGATTFNGQFEGHVLLDLGDDDFTRGRPHPMIDPAARDAAVRAQGADAQVAVILFDLVLGHGSHADPASGLARALVSAQAQARQAGRELALIGHVCGTDGDPQGRAAQIQQLEQAGALILGSNVEAAQLAADIALRRAAASG